MKNKTFLPVIVATLIIFSLVSASCSSPTEDNNSQSPTGQTTEVLMPATEGVDGYLVYISKCSPCHGINRQGGLGPSLKEDISITFLSDFLPVHRTGVNMDPRLENVLINWLYSNSVPSTKSPPTDAYHIFLTSCAMCHGIDRNGGPGGPSIMPEQLTNFDQEFLTAFLLGHFSGFTLSQAQREHLSYWLVNPPPPPPDFDTAEGVENYYCGACHPGDGPSLFEGSVGGSVSSVIAFVNGHLPGVPTDQLTLLAQWLATQPETTTQ